MNDATTNSASRLLIVLIAFLAVGCASPIEDAYRGDGESTAHTHHRFQNNPSDFQFAVIGDRTGGHREGVFSQAIELLNLLRPEFVIGVGDLIEGYVEDETVLRSQWTEVDDDLERLDMPFFFVPGNHDVNFDPSEKVWFDRVGATRGYSHFVFKNVLFLQINTEDPPKQNPGNDLEEKYERLKSGEVDAAEGREIVEELEAWAGKINISDSQLAYFKEVFASNPHVRWTFGFMHSPAWAQTDPGNFAKLEALLADRPYTMFAGHTHTYEYVHRNERDYITMGLTGGLSPALATPGNMDHVAWVTMTDEGPVIGNLLLNGIPDKKGAVPALQDFLLYRPR
jgi:hypothetical protein